MIMNAKRQPRFRRRHQCIAYCVRTVTNTFCIRTHYCACEFYVRLGRWKTLDPITRSVRRIHHLRYYRLGIKSKYLSEFYQYNIIYVYLHELTIFYQICFFSCYLLRYVQLFYDCKSYCYNIILLLYYYHVLVRSHVEYFSAKSVWMGLENGHLVDTVIKAKSRGRG